MTKFSSVIEFWFLVHVSEQFFRKSHYKSYLVDYGGVENISQYFIDLVRFHIMTKVHRQGRKNKYL